MNLEITWRELARAAGGALVAGEGSEAVRSLSTDTRRLEPGQAFWALKGERYDAHELLTPELAAKAAGLIVEQGRLGNLKPSHAIEVTNTLKALQALAASHRRRFDLPVVGITGSNGKTTTKEMLACICRRVGATCASPGNWNNQVGVPLSVLELSSEHRYAVFELADSHPGDIDEVARIAQPTLALLTNLGPDHLEFYGSMEKNFKTKSELLAHLPADGRAVINLDDPWLAGLEPRLGAKAVTFGAGPRARVRFADDDIIVDRHKIKVRLRAFGRLSRYNAAAAAAAAWALGIGPETIGQGLEDYRPAGMRLERRRHPSGAEVVLDAYNANPASMRAAIEAFCDEFPRRAKVLVLGDMKELGVSSRQFHEELGAWLAGLPLRAVFLAGPEMAAAYRALSAAKPRFEVAYDESPEPWLPRLRAALGPDAALFLKASRAMRLEAVAEALQCSTI